MPELTNIEELLLHCVKDLYSAETQLLDALPLMSAAASDPALAAAFANHLEETRSHVLRLEQVADLLGDSPHGMTCIGMEGLIAEGQEILQMEGEAAIKDLALTGAARKVEHYEIAAYCGARELAEAVGHQEVVGLLQTTEDEEKAADKLMMALAAKAVGSASAELDQLS